jgi:hypothetical protein
MSEILTPEQVKEYKARRVEEERELKEEVREWRMEIYKMLASLAINVFVILVLILGTLNCRPCFTFHELTRDSDWCDIWSNRHPNSEGMKIKP